MQFVRSWLLPAVALLAFASIAAAQTTNGAISGHVADSQGLALPGVTVNAASPNLQGVRTVVTSENGDYVLELLPPGQYTVSFELSGFQMVQKTVALAPTQRLPLDATLGPAAVTETVNVVGRAADVLTQTAQVATNFKQDLIATLPTNRSIDAALLLAPAVHPTGPGGNYSIAGAASFESLFLVNGVTVNENVRGQAENLYIEDAIQETTVATAGISAEYGRFSGGVVNVITKSGGNLFSGSFRDTYANDNWRAHTSLNAGTSIPGDRTQTVPTATVADGANYPGDVKFNHNVPLYEYTFGGPVAKDHLWFFTAGRLTEQISNRQLAAPVNTPYTFTENQKRYEGNVTYSLNANHRVQGVYTKITDDQLNGVQGFPVMDLSSLYNASEPEDLFTLNYSGIVTHAFFLEGRFSDRHLKFAGIGSPSTDIINGTLVRDLLRGTRYWTSTFCGVCDPETRDNNDAFVKGTYFLSKKGRGSHTMVFGFDSFNDERFSNNHQSGSDYRILGTTSIVRGTDVFPQFLNSNTVIQYNPIPVSSLGTNFRTNSLFYNDNWRASNRVTLNLGLRWDKNHGVDSSGALVTKDSAFSPRFGVVWDPSGDGRWSVTASFGRYVSAIANNIADSSSSAGNPAAYQWAYLGPSINPDPTAATLVTTPAALQQVFNWCARASNGFCTSTPLVAATVPGVSVKIPDGLTSPNVLEYAAGVSRQFGSRAAVRADFTFRDFRDFYSQRIDTTTGIVVDSLGHQSDITIVENSNDVKRRYTGVTISSTYRFSARTDVGGNYTISRLWGNFDGENSGSGPIPVDYFQYPEYRQLSWYAPMGDLSADQRHRSRLWINYGVPSIFGRLNGLTLSALEELASGLPYGAVGPVDARPFVTNPGYVTPQGSNTENYYFTARDAFRTDAEYRTDFAASYNHRLPTGSRPVELFFQMHLLNVFNQFQLCGCGANVFLNGGNVFLTRIGQGVQTGLNTSSLTRFNPFTTTPVQGVNWNLGPNFGTAVSRFAYTSPRTFRLTFGVRF